MIACRPIQLLSLLCCVATTLGCSKSGVETVPVRGKITYDGGEWPTNGLVVFAPKKAADGFPRRAGQSIVQRDGTFEATTFSPNDGLIPGTYSVNLRCVENSKEDITKGKNFVPMKYRRGNTSGFEVVVPADDSKPVVVEFDVPKAKKAGV